MAVTDLVMLDIKEIDPQKHLALTGRPNDKILAYARYLAQKGIPIWIRHVVVPGITDDPDDLFALGEFIAGLKTIKALDVLPYHDMGKVKYKALGIPYPLEGIPPMSKEGAAKAKDIILSGMKKRLKEQRSQKMP